MSTPDILSSVPARWRGLVLPVAAVLLWVLASHFQWVNSALLVSPLQVLATGLDLVTSGQLWLNLRASLLRELTGFVMGSPRFQCNK